jgi:hypothetical protein
MGDPVNQYENPDSPTVLLRRLHRWRMAFFGLVILLAGMLSGAAATLLVVGHIGRESRPPAADAVKELLLRVGPRLHLSEEQVKQVQPIVGKHMQRLDEIRQKGRTEIVEELRLMNEEMFTVLNENQARLWQQLLQGLPGEMRHVPDWYGPGAGRGPGPRRRMGPPADRPGPLHVSPNNAPAPPNDVTPHNAPGPLP